VDVPVVEEAPTQSDIPVSDETQTDVPAVDSSDTPD
jgi:preprotein translocase subunit SecG